MCLPIYKVYLQIKPPKTQKIISGQVDFDRICLGYDKFYTVSYALIFPEDHRITACVGFIKCFMEQHQYKSSKHHGSLPKIVSGDPPDSPREDPRSHSLSESLPVVPRSESAHSARSGSISSPREQVTLRPNDNSCTCTPQVTIFNKI